MQRGAYRGTETEITKGGYEKEIQARVSASWKKWKEMKTVLNDKRMPMRVKARMYTTVVRPLMTYDSEKRKLDTTKIRMQRMMLGVTLKDKLRNEDVRRRTTVVNFIKLQQVCYGKACCN